eukprot:3730628-Pleurochrysis_carterae.AAC.1
MFQDELVFSVSLDLSRPDDKVMALRLWERALTVASDSWKSAKVRSEIASNVHRAHHACSHTCVSATFRAS